jgi:hypothetical protein
MAEIVGKIDPKVLEIRQHQARLDKPGVLQEVRRENKAIRERWRAFEEMRKDKKIKAKREEKKVLSGKFNQIKVRGS